MPEESWRQLSQFFDEAMGWMTRVQLQAGTQMFLFATTSKPALRPNHLPIQCVLIPKGYSGWRVETTTYIYPVLRLKCMETYLHSPIHFPRVMINYTQWTTLSFTLLR
jgi:hypothetical protein